VARIWVRAPSLVGRSEMMSPRTTSGRWLMRSSSYPASVPPGASRFIFFDIGLPGSTVFMAAAAAAAANRSRLQGSN
jgi:hypothetical protein